MPRIRARTTSDKDGHAAVPGPPADRDTINVMPLQEWTVFGGMFEGPPPARDFRWIAVWGVAGLGLSLMEDLRSGLDLWITMSCVGIVFMHLNSHLLRCKVAGVVRYPLCALAAFMATGVVVAAEQVILGR